MRNYFFLRHFETIYNRNRLLSGCEMDIPVLKTSSISCDIRMDAVFCSDALRCRQTVAAFLDGNPAPAVFFSNLLLERDLGILQGKSRAIAAKMYPSLFENGRLDVFSTPPEGESYAQFRRRTERAKAWIAQNSNYTDNVLICSHNQFLKMLFFLLTGEPVEQSAWSRLTFPLGEIVRVSGVVEQ
jgi:broad specificity phosphatase PhoE